MAFIKIGFMTIILVSLLSAQDSLEVKLIADWEKIQRSDPKTTVFEKQKDRLYKFSTKYFEFNGTLRLLNAFVESNPYDTLFPYRGTLEVELLGMPKDFMEKYHMSYAHWNQSNFLHYQRSTGKWVTTQQYSKLRYEMNQAAFPAKTPFIEYFREYIFYFVLLFIIVVAILFMNSIKGNLELLRLLTKSNNELLKQLLSAQKKTDNLSESPSLNKKAPE
jgi:hypothetical protein